MVHALILRLRFTGWTGGVRRAVCVDFLRLTRCYYGNGLGRLEVARTDPLGVAELEMRDLY